MIKRAEVFFQDRPAGLLEQNPGGFLFLYHQAWLADKTARPVSLTLPLAETPYTAQRLFPFFDGLIPEGWLLNLAVTESGVDAGDRMALLLALCGDCIGAVSVRPLSGGDT
jgi:serine/threonine-protein kinase HipA